MKLQFGAWADGLHVGRRAYFVRYMFFLRIRPCYRSPFGAWSKFHTPSKDVKNGNKPRLQNSLVLHLEIANVYDGTSRSSRRRSHLLLSLMP